MLENDQIEEIKKWFGFEDFDGKNVNYTIEGEGVQGKLAISVLMQAVEEGNVNIVSDLIRLGADVNFLCKTSQRTPLFFMDDSLSNTPNKLEIASLLISNGADINFIRQLDFGDGLLKDSFLSKATAFLNFDLVKLLIDNGARLEDEYNPWGEMFLEHPMLQKRWGWFIKISDLLISNGANINSDYGTLLKYYIEGDKYDQAYKLISLGAKTEIKPPEPNYNDFKGRTALMVFLDNSGFHNNTESENEKFFFKLWDRVKNINVQDDDGKTLLFYAIDEPAIGEDDFFMTIFDLIVSNDKLDFNVQDNDGNTALNYLISMCPKEEIFKTKHYSESVKKSAYYMLQTLIKKSDVDISNNDGETPKQFLDFVNINYNEVNNPITDHCIICKSIKIDGRLPDIYLLNNDSIHKSCLEKINSQRTDLDLIISENEKYIYEHQNEISHLNSFLSKLKNIFDPSTKDRIKSLKLKLNDLIKDIEDLKKDKESILLENKRKLYHIYSYWLKRPPDWELRRSKALTVQDFCTKCGDFENTLHVHHKRPISKGGDHTISNLKVLCAKCHSQEHGGISFDDTDKFSVTESAFEKKYRLLREAVESGRQVKFKYYKYSGEMSKRSISPESFKKLGKSLCVEGFCFLRESNRVFNISRMKNLTVLG